MAAEGLGLTVISYIDRYRYTFCISDNLRYYGFDRCDNLIFEGDFTDYFRFITMLLTDSEPSYIEGNPCYINQSGGIDK